VQKENPDSVVLLHTRGFYNAFGKDAEILAKVTNYTAPGKNLYGNVFTPCCQVLDFNLSYATKRLLENNIEAVVMALDKGVIDRYSPPSLDEVQEPSEYDDGHAAVADVLYDDAFYVDRDKEIVSWMYYNPDGNDGKGQFVTNSFHFEVILEAAQKHADFKDFFDYLGTVSQQEFADYGSEFFDGANEYFHEQPDYTECSLETMQALVEEAKEFEKETSANVEISRNSFLDEYNEIKADNPNSIVLYQVGDFFEAFNDDAKTLATSLQLVLTSRAVNDDERVPMVGFPAHRLEAYIDEITKKGFDVAISAIENGERKTYSIVSLSKEKAIKEAPVETAPASPNVEKTLAERLVDFYRDFDFYGFRDTLEIGESEEDAASKLAADLQSPKSIDSIIAQLKNIVEEAETDDKEIAEQLIKELEKEKENLPVIPDSELIGKEVMIDGTKFVIERIDPVFGDVSMRDTSVLYPINRVEKIGLVRELLNQQTAPTYSTEKVAEIPAEESGLPFDVTIQTLRTEEPALTPPVWEEKKEKVTTLHPTVPDSEKHNFRITDDNLGVGGAKEKFRNNMAAINLLHELEFENRLATPEEQETLSKYVGFGGLADAFDESKTNWADEYKELIVTLSPEEYAAARESTLTAFYTPPVVIRAMYEALGNMGFENGNILEPSCGTGNFIGMLPDKMSESKFYGVE
ncbi:MAG: hypothetical protein IKM23_07785, partial [Bacteroidales bacterium]|nr:hypothetical protein [Bacteroidales bacterium]